MARNRKKYKLKRERFLGYGVTATIHQLKMLKAVLIQSNKDSQKNNKPPVQLICFKVEDEDSITYFVFGIPVSSPVIGALLAQIVQETHGPLGELNIEDISKDMSNKNY